jgi:hypothetical protein
MPFRALECRGDGHLIAHMIIDIQLLYGSSGYDSDEFPDRLHIRVLLYYEAAWRGKGGCSEGKKK